MWRMTQVAQISSRSMTMGTSPPPRTSWYRSASRTSRLCEEDGCFVGRTGSSRAGGSAYPRSELSYRSDAPRPEQLPGLIRNLEHTLCARLDRIEGMLQGWEQPPVQSEEKECLATAAAAAAAGNGNAAAKKCEACLPGINNRVLTYSSLSHNNVMSGLTLRKEWEVDAECFQPVAVETRARMSDTAAPMQSSSSQKPASRWIIRPSSRFRLIWDFIMFIILAHDMAVVPMVLSFDDTIAENPVSLVLYYPFLLYWTLDIPLSFFTGYYRNGQAEMRQAWIACHYVCTWFLVDAFVLGASWWEVWVRAHPQDGFLLGRAGKSLRFLRVLRALRVLRLVKFRTIVRELENRVTSEYRRIIIQVCKLILTIVWLNHFVACAWWAIADSSSETEQSWIETYGYKSKDLSLQYFTSLHWSLTQFTPASMDVSARTLNERIFSVVVLLFAMVTFSSFVSSLTAATTQLRQITDHFDMNYSLLRRYLSAHQVPLDLCIRILQCVEHRLSKQKSEITESQVPFLEYLSKPLHMELSLHIFAPVLNQHPLFRRYSEVDSVSMRKVCIEAVSQLSLYMEDLVFAEGGMCGHMFFVLSGQLIYSSRRRQEGTDPAATTQTIAWDEEALTEGTWCCEICLWYPWVHRGSMISMTLAEVLTLTVASFLDITSSFPLVHRLATRYAALHAESLQDHASLGNVINDLSPFSTDTLEEMVERAFILRGSFPKPSGGTPSESDAENGEMSL